MTEISNYTNNDCPPIKNTETIFEVRSFFDEVDFSHFPVIEDNIFIGNISKEDAETFELDKKVSDYRYSLDGFFVRNHQNWMEVLEVFAKNQTNILPVLDKENQYIGYYELESIVSVFSETPFLKEQGSIIVVKKSVLDYSIGQVTQIVENNNGKILGLFISDSDPETVQITIKISSGNVNEIIQSFRRYEYEVTSNHQDDSYINILKERSEYLERYLSI
jgi:predicted transcriptional regulator